MAESRRQRTEEERSGTQPPAADATLPETLYVSSPHGRQNCIGEYKLFAWEKPNGQNLWKQTDGECWLYSSINGRWVIGGHEAKNKQFACSTGYIASQKLHEGRPPNEFNGTWEMARWHEDPSIKVTAVGDTAPNGVPEVLEIVSPTGRKQCAGEYARVPGESPNGKPLWKQRTGDHWLYSGTKGSWLVGGGEEKADNFCCSSGVIVCGQPHDGAMPHKVPGLWWWTGRALDDGIRITAGSPSDTEPASSSERFQERLPVAALFVLVVAVMVAAVASVRSDKFRPLQYFLGMLDTAAKSGANGDVSATIFGLFSRSVSSTASTSNLAEKVKTAMIVLLVVLCYQVRSQASRTFQEKESELQALRGQLAQSGMQLSRERSKVAQLGEELKAQRDLLAEALGQKPSVAQSFSMADNE